MLFIIVREWADVEVFHNPSYNEGEEEEGEKKKSQWWEEDGGGEYSYVPSALPSGDMAY